MDTILQLIKLAAVLIAAIMLGNWFLAEVRAARSRRKPWYAAYLTLPGILILMIVVALPLVLWHLGRG